MRWHKIEFYRYQTCNQVQLNHKSSMWLKYTSNFKVVTDLNARARLGFSVGQMINCNRFLWYQACDVCQKRCYESFSSISYWIMKDHPWFSLVTEPSVTYLFNPNFETKLKLFRRTFFLISLQTLHWCMLQRLVALVAKVSWIHSKCT